MANQKTKNRGKLDGRSFALCLRLPPPPKAHMCTLSFKTIAPKLHYPFCPSGRAPLCPQKGRDFFFWGVYATVVLGKQNERRKRTARTQMQRRPGRGETIVPLPACARGRSLSLTFALLEGIRKVCVCVCVKMVTFRLELERLPAASGCLVFCCCCCCCFGLLLLDCC